MVSGPFHATVHVTVDVSDLFPDVGDYGPPEGHSATALATHDYDGTYGASLGSLAVRTCRRCGAIVDAAGTERHDAWHRMIEGCRRCGAIVDAAGTERHDAWHRMIEGAPW